MKTLPVLLFVLLSQGCLFSGNDPIDSDIGPGADDVGSADMEGRTDMSPGSDGGHEPDAAVDMGDPEDFGDCPPQPTDTVSVNVSDDAASDGSCDCTCTLRDAAAHVAPGGVVTFEVSEIVLDDDLAIETSDISIDGGAAGVEVDASSVPGAALMIQESASDVSIARLRIIGAPIGLAVRGVRGTFEQMLVENGSLGALVTTSAADVVIEASTFRNLRFHGVFIMGGLGPVELVDSEVVGNGGHGLQLRRANARVEGNVIAGNDLHGILVDVEVTAPGDRTVIAGNEIGQPTAPNKLGGIEVVRAGVIDIGGSERLTQTCNGPCNVIGPNRYGVLVQSADEVSLQGNFIGLGGDGNTPRANRAGVIIGLQSADGVDASAGQLLDDGWVRRGIGGACAHSGDCLGDVDVDGDGELEQYECVAERFDVAARTFAYPGGMCTAVCDNATNPCAEGICVGTRCFAECATDDDCRRGYTCSDAACRWSPGDVPPPGEDVRSESRGQTVIGRAPGAAAQAPWTTCNGGCNMIAANTGNSVSVVAAPNTSVVGNFIGTGADPQADVSSGTNPEQHHGLAVHPSTASAGRVVVRGNIIGAHAGAGMFLRTTAEVDDNWIGFGHDGTSPQPVRGGIIVANGSVDHQIRGNTLGNVSLNGILVAQGASAVIRNNLIGENSSAYHTGIRVYDTNSSAEIRENTIINPASAGIAIGARLNGLPDALVGVNVEDNTIERGCDIAGIQIPACSVCNVKGNTITETGGPGLLIGSAGQGIDFSQTTINDNVLEYIGEPNTTFNFVPAVAMRGGTGAMIHNNQILNPDGAGFALGATGTDPDFSDTEFHSNTVTCSAAGWCQGSGFEVFSGFGGVLYDNTIIDFQSYGINLIDAGTARTSIGFWGNVVVDPFYDSINFDGVSDPDDGRDDLDNGANTLLNTPTLQFPSNGNTGEFHLGGEVNFADARIDAYRSDGTTDYPLLSHLGTCYSDPSAATPPGSETFACMLPRTDTNGDVVEQVQATVSGRHYVIYIDQNATSANVTITAHYRNFQSNVSGTNPAEFAANLALAIRTNYPELLAAPGTCGPFRCVHVVGGRMETSFDATGAAILNTQSRGWVTSKMLETVTAVP